MTRDESIAALTDAGKHWSQQPMTVPVQVVRGRQAQSRGMLRALEVMYTAESRPPPDDVEWSVGE